MAEHRARWQKVAGNAIALVLVVGTAAVILSLVVLALVAIWRVIL